uniref:Autophagy-related protein n=1 Tax=Macrostomum lignano TaxID=282301 RepID=A0A1I8F5Q7_9PLAT
GGGGSGGSGGHRDNDSVESFDVRKSFKAKKSLGQRQAESYHIKTKFPAKIPVIVERYEKERTLPHLDKTKFLGSPWASLPLIIRNRMKIDHSQSIASMSATIAEIYEEERDEDGFLYMSYASQEMFGSCCSCSSCCFRVPGAAAGLLFSPNGTSKLQCRKTYSKPDRSISTSTTIFFFATNLKQKLASTYL